MTPLVIAHRGASALAPEHTAAAYARAIADGADVIEVDLQLTRDGVLVALHDDTLTRVTAGASDARVAELTAAELDAFDVGAWFSPEYAGAHVTTFDHHLDLLDAHDGLRLTVELKDPALYTGEMEAAVAATLEQRGYAQQPPVADARVIVSSFDLVALERLATVLPGVPRSFVWFELSPRNIACELPEWIDAVAPHLTAVGLAPELVANAHERGRAVHVWTVDDADAADYLVELSVDGMFTDDPAMLRTFLSGRL